MGSYDEPVHIVERERNSPRNQSKKKKHPRISAAMHLTQNHTRLKIARIGGIRVSGMTIDFSKSRRGLLSRYVSSVKTFHAARDF